MRQELSEDGVVAQLRAAGCVFAEEEATILREAAADDADLTRLVARRVAGEPIEHLVGWVEFAGRRLAVGPGVFVPRRRSELLAAVAVGAAASRQRPVMVEPYCGAAPLASTVGAWMPTARVYATDIDDVALRCARRNLGADAGVLRGSGLAGLPAALRGRVDVIAAVPPYVPDAALALLPHEAADHEPRRALLAGADGLNHIGTLIAQAPGWLAADGVLAIEMNEEQAQMVTDPDDRFPTAALARRVLFARPVLYATDDSRTVVLALTMPG